MKFVFLVLILLFVIEHEISPRIDIVRGRQVILWYTWYKKRHNILLFTL